MNVVGKQDVHAAVTLGRGPCDGVAVR